MWPNNYRCGDDDYLHVIIIFIPVFQEITLQQLSPPKFLFIYFPSTTTVSLYVILLSCIHYEFHYALSYLLYLHS